jgi:hypothetical protein
VKTNLDTLLIALYVELDDHVVIPRPVRPGGFTPKLTDAELVCLAVAQVLLGFASEHHWLRFCRTRLGHLFPYLPGQPGYNRRLRAARPLLQRAIVHVASRSPSWWDDLWLADSTPVPCAASRQTVDRSALWGHAGYGYCASHSRFFWGFRLHLLTAGDGLPVMWCLAHPKLGDREVLAAMLDRDHRLVRAGQVIVADKGYAGRDIEALVAGYGARLVRPDRRDERRRHGDLGGVRQWIESVNDTMKGQLSLEQHGGRTTTGVFVRVAQRLLAMAAAIWHNWTTGQTTKRSLTAYDH